MTELTIAIDEQKLAQLRERASLMGLSTNELLIKTIDDLLTMSEEEFIALVKDILQQNAELYRRLA